MRAIGPRLHALDPGCEPLAVVHLGDGNIHYSVWPPRDDPTLMAAMRTAIDALAMEMSSTFSAEHGVGLSKLPP